MAVHQTMDRHRKKKAYRERKKAGLCVRCGKCPPRADKTTCAGCGKSQSANSSKYSGRIIPALRKLKVCLHCHDASPVFGKQLCGRCAERMIESQAARRAARREAGLCPYCGGERDRKGRVSCASCAAVRNRHSSEYHARQRELAA